MDMNLGLTTTLKQEQTLTPQMLQSLALLPMPILELKAHIQEEIQSNPALEIPDTEFQFQAQSQNTETRVIDDRLDDADSSYYESTSFENPSFDPEASDRKQMLIENTALDGETLKEHLEKQIGELQICDSERSNAILLVSNLNSDGFFILPLETLFENTNATKEEIDKAVALVQSLDPAGVCVSDFRQSLILQAKLSGMAEQDLKVFSEMVNNHLEKLKNGKFKEVSVSLHVPEEDVMTLFSILKSFTPYPGANFGSDGEKYIEPDLSIHVVDGSLIVDLNKSDIPQLVVSQEFQDLAAELKGPDAKEASSYISKSIRDANQLIQQVNMRFDTLYKAACAIADIQSEFFFNGPRYLKTMTLRDVAERIGVHEATMSRLAQSKYIETDFGLFQLKYFFSQGVPAASDSSETVSRNVVKEMIREIISEKGALSDQKISDLLLEKGVKCARRTVSKYRAELNIDSSYSR